MYNSLSLVGAPAYVLVLFMKTPIFGTGNGSILIFRLLRIKLVPLEAKKSGFTGISTRSQQDSTLYESSVKDGGQSKRTTSYFGSFTEFWSLPRRRRMKSFTPSRSNTSSSIQ